MTYMVESVPLLDLKPQYQQYKDKLLPELLEVIESQAFILGPKVEKMEKELAEYIGVKYALGVSSGTDALLIALMALGIGNGDEVITTPYTFFATAGVIHRVGARAVFVDIEPDTFNIDASKIEKAITSRTRAILPVHLFGQCCDMDKIMYIAKKHNIKVIEDACQSIGAKFQDKQAGSIGDIGAFSFFPSKNLGCFGDGGLITTNDETLYNKMKSLRVHGSEKQYFHNTVGINGRLDAIQAVVISAKLPYLKNWTEGRRKNADAYDRLFSKSSKITIPARKPDRYHIYNQYVIKVEKRDELREYLTNKKIGTAIYYPLPLHLQKCFSYLGYKEGDFPVAEECAKKSIALPIYAELPQKSLEYVAETIINFYS